MSKAVQSNSARISSYQKKNSLSLAPSLTTQHVTFNTGYDDHFILVRTCMRELTQMASPDLPR